MNKNSRQINTSRADYSMCPTTILILLLDGYVVMDHVAEKDARMKV